MTVSACYKLSDSSPRSLYRIDFLLRAALARTETEIYAVQTPSRQSAQPTRLNRHNLSVATRAVQRLVRPITASRQALMSNVTLEHVRDPLSHYINLRPALIDTSDTAFRAQVAAFQKRTTPHALIASPLHDDAVTSVHGREADGKPFQFQRATLASRIAPYLKEPAAFGDGGAYSFTPIMVNEDRTVLPEFASFFPPAESWDRYFLGSEPNLFPVDLLGVTHTKDKNGVMTTQGPKINTSLILGIGVGEGQEAHWHGANIFLQVHGEKKWSLFSNPDLYAYFQPGKLYERRKPCPFDPKYAHLFKQPWWEGAPDMPRPTELITRPGDMLYLPTGTWHLTWNLTDYTFGYTKVVEL